MEPSRVVPDVVSYTKEQQNKVADEVQSGYCSASAEFLKDYLVMRDQARVSQ